MITVTPQNLDPAQSRKLREWLNDPAAGIFRDIVEGHARRCQQDAVAHLMKDTDENRKTGAVCINDALRYQHCRDVLDQIAKTETFETVKVS